jgi:hypothetical protein
MHADFSKSLYYSKYFSQSMDQNKLRLCQIKEKNIGMEAGKWKNI